MRHLIPSSSPWSSPTPPAPAPAPSLLPWTRSSLFGKKIVALEGESVHPRFWAKAVTSDEEGRKRSCWAEARGREA